MSEFLTTDLPTNQEIPPNHLASYIEEDLILGFNIGTAGHSSTIQEIYGRLKVVDLPPKPVAE